MNQTQIIAVRHGETQWNREKRWQGHNDSPLTKKGLDQAKAVANHLAEVQFSSIYSSDLDRACKTAEQIYKISGIKIITDARLRERNLGIFEGLTKPEMKSQFPEAFNKYQNQDPGYAVPKGESIKQCYARSTAFLKEIPEKHPGETIVVVTHGGVLNAYFRFIIGLPLEAPRRYQLFNASINRFSYTDGHFILNSFGHIDHLNHIESLDDS